jgi:hypothetical protein
MVGHIHRLEFVLEAFGNDLTTSIDAFSSVAGELHVEGVSCVTAASIR